MSSKGIALATAGLAISLGAVVLSPLWVILTLVLSRSDPPTTSALPQPIAPPSAAQPGPGSSDPFPLSPASVGPAPTPHPMKRGANRAMRAAVISELSAEIGSLKSRLQNCPDQHIRRAGEVSATEQRMIEFVQGQIASGGKGRNVPPPIAAGEDADGATQLPTIMMLEVETYESQVKIVDAALAMPGSASEAFVACAQSVLRGQIFVVPAATPGEHLRIPVDLDGTGVEGQPQRHTARRRR